MRGRKPKIDGPALGHRKHADLSAPLPPGAPECPVHLTGYGREEWTRLCIEQESLGRLATAFRGVMEVAALSKKQIVRLSRKLDREKNEDLRVSLGRQLNQFNATYHKSLAEMGLTPVSRARVKDDGGKRED